MMRAPLGLRRGAAALFQTAVRVRSEGYDRGLLSVVRVPDITVISVGNLRTGGSGKTPLVAYLTEQLLAMGHRPAVVSRGYKGCLERSGGLISDGSGPRVTAADAGDEAFWLAKRLRVPVLVGANRVRSVQAARALGCDAAVLDDGFSHRRLFRDLDILSVHPADLSPTAATLPLGDLREPSIAAKRAHLLTGFDADFQQRTSGERKPDFTFIYEPLDLVDADGHPSSLPHLPTRAYLVSGIANPARFERTARSVGFRVAGASCFRDHHVFRTAEIIRIFEQATAAGAELVLTTEKDMVRIPTLKCPMSLRALRIRPRIVVGEARLRESLAGLFSSVSP